jgi:hypothetical protein
MIETHAARCDVLFATQSLYLAHRPCKPRRLMTIFSALIVMDTVVEASLI